MEDTTGQMLLQGTKELHILPDIRTTFQLFAAHLRRVQTPWSYPSHTHAMFELNVVTEGMQRFTREGAVYEQQPGDIFLVRPAELHECVSDGQGTMSYFCMHFLVDDPVLRRTLLALDRGLYPAGSPLELRIGPAVSRLIELATVTKAETAADRMKALSTVYSLLAALSEAAPEDGGGSGERQSVSLQATRLAESIARRIELAVTSREAGVDSEAAIGDIARMLGYSAAYCRRVFHETYSMSPRAFRSALMLREAKLLLLDPDLTMEGIAARLGYEDAATFSKQFRRWTGMSPREYRSISR
ncbi:AraC family transcriptional regulator [Cohnella lubricantis]|uniref:AraC family transcriptional regulator n=1 Tax=Cohnella lubricantis TaxID=2163172 RepID=A0A841TAY6_9BACL|nr:AraC family transcriptional regulator [Cohnella lubricantis]MBB6677246.1 AraC family transcriptional regulator [Cohnella lubricantis]MBP2116943.1 AraC-like DNA-binding protein/mannose-6-phosphate isomerase-like protein (cupin superfamily) [Cohnella lubricantis]